MVELMTGRRIYLARHGQTADNRVNIASGRHNNTHLTHAGIASAVDLKELVEKLDPPINASISSSLNRAELTEYMATFNLPITHLPADAGLDERDFETKGVVKEDGESYIDHQNRAVAAINNVLKDPDCLPLIVCHGGTIRRVMDAIGNFQKAPDYITIPNAVVIEVVTPSSSTAQDWQINIISQGPNGIERRPVALNAEMYKRNPDEPRSYRA